MITQTIGAGPIMFRRLSIQVTGRIIKILLPITAHIPASKVRITIRIGKPIAAAEAPTVTTMIMIGAVMIGTAAIQIGTVIGD